MRTLILVSSFAVACCLLPIAGAHAAVSTTASDSRATQSPSEAELILAEADFALQMARDGQYGRIASTDMAALRQAHAQIRDALQGVATLAELDAPQRSRVEAAREQIGGLLRSDEKDRKICKRVERTGSRVTGMECLTVAERESRARASQAMAADAQRGFCVPGTDNPSGEQVSRCVR